MWRNSLKIKTNKNKLFRTKKHLNVRIHSSYKSTSKYKNDNRNKFINRGSNSKLNGKVTIQQKSFPKRRTLLLRKDIQKAIQYKNYLRMSGEESSENDNLEKKEEFTNKINDVTIAATKNAYYHGKRLYCKKVSEGDRKKQIRKNDHKNLRVVTSDYNRKSKDEYRRHKIKQTNSKYEGANHKEHIKTENNFVQVSKSNKMLAFSNSKRNNGQSISQGVKRILKDKLGLGKEKFSSIHRTVVLYILGILALILIPVVLVLAILCNSPFAIFLPNTGTGETIMTVTSSYISDFNQEINELAEHPSNCDAAKIVYLNHEGDSSIPSNYYDIIAVYMVRYGIGNMATIVDDSSKENLKQVFNDMCIYTTKEKIEKQEDNGIETTKKILLIKVKLKTYQDMISYYQFSEEEIELLEMLMSPENRALFGSILEDENLENDMSSSTIEAVISNISKEEVKTVLNFALSKLGYPYSQAYRDSGKYYDCSSLTYYAWRSVGVNLTYEGANTAAQQAKLCNDKGYTVSYADIQPGDLIFYSFGYNGRYKNISHVAIYCGDGMLVDASYSQQKVVYRKVYSRENIVLIGRPSK